MPETKTIYSDQRWHPTEVRCPSCAKERMAWDGEGAEMVRCLECWKVTDYYEAFKQWAWIYAPDRI